MRVLLFSDADVFAGTERHMFDLAKGLNAEGIETRIGSPTPSILKDRADSAGIGHVCIQKRGLIDRAAIKQLVQLLKNKEIDIIHAHNGRTMLSAAIAVTLARTGKAAATQHFLDPDHAAKTGVKSMIYHSAHAWVSSRLSGYIAISDAVRDTMLSRKEAPPEKITVIHNGMYPVDILNQTPPAEVRASLNIPSDHLLIVSAARLEQEKNIVTLISAVEQVRRKHPNVTCLIAGSGTLEGELKSQITNMNQEANIRLLGFREDAISLIGACDLFVLPSVAEPFGLVLLEAMALGKPVIATDAGGPKEIVVSGSTGNLVPPSDPAAMATAIEHFIEHRSDLERMGKRGKERFNELFSAKTMSQRIAAFYEKILKQHATINGNGNPA